jgi:hypothetical protein
MIEMVEGIYSLLPFINQLAESVIEEPQARQTRLLQKLSVVMPT